MIAKLREIITGKTSAPTAEIKITAACLVNGQPASPGDILEVSVRDAEILINSDRAERILTPEQKAKAGRLAALIPPPWTACQLPETWASLPKPFQQLWELNERFRCAYGRANEIEVCILRGYGMTSAEMAQFADEISRATPDGKTRSSIVSDWLQQRCPQLQIRIEIGDNDPAAEERRKLADALNRQHQTIAGMITDNREELVRLKFECGDLALAENARARRVAKELGVVAFDIFAKRIEALGLGEAENRRLFVGTREYLLYVHQVNKPSDLRLAWSDGESGEARHFLAGSIHQLADQYRTYNAEADHLEGLLREAKAELKRTVKAAA